MAGLLITEIGLRRDQRDILKAITIGVVPGKVVTLLGPSGSGKTALLRAVAGLARPHRGSIRVGEELVFCAARRIDVPAHKRGIGLVFQSDALSPRWSVFDNVAFCARLAGGKNDIKQQTGRALEQAGVLDLAGRRPSQLSAFDRRRVAIARDHLRGDSGGL